VVAAPFGWNTSWAYVDDLDNADGLEDIGCTHDGFALDGLELRFAASLFDHCDKLFGSDLSGN